MKSFEQMFSEFYGAEIDDAAQIQLYSHSGTELKYFVKYCIEQTGTNTLVMGRSELLVAFCAYLEKEGAAFPFDKQYLIDEFLKASNSP